MGAPQVLPDADVLRSMLQAGKTQREIADEFGVTKQAVSFHVRRRDLMPPPPRYPEYIPWKIAERHQNAHKYHMLQAYARRQVGEKPLTELGAKQLDGFLRKLDAKGAVVDYTDELGFHFVAARPGIDTAYIRDPRK